MRYITIAILLVFSLSSHAHPAKAFVKSEAKTKISADLKDFLKSFETQVKINDASGVMEFMDTEYLDVQLKGMLDGNLEQFLNEFFCGENMETKESQCANFRDIKKLKRHSLTISGPDEFEVAYYIIGKGFKLDTEWFISAKKEGEFTTYGLIGAMG
jgi:hypothetical protein